MWFFVLLVGIIALAIARFGKVEELTKRRLYIVGFVIIGAYLFLLLFIMFFYATPLTIEVF